MARRNDAARLMLIGTYRCGDAMGGHPLYKIVNELLRQQQLTLVPLDYLTEADVKSFCREQWEGDWTTQALADLLYQRTGGHPLFLVMLVEELRHMGMLRRKDCSDHTVMEAIRRTIPATLREAVEQQLHGMTPLDYSVLAAGSVAGRTFSAAAVAAVLNKASEDIQWRLKRLAHGGRGIQLGNRSGQPEGEAESYTFRNDLYREVLYDRIPPARKRRWRLRLAAGDEDCCDTRAPAAGCA